MANRIETALEIATRLLKSGKTEAEILAEHSDDVMRAALREARASEAVAARAAGNAVDTGRVTRPFNLSPETPRAAAIAPAATTLSSSAARYAGPARDLNVEGGLFGTTARETQDAQRAAQAERQAAATQQQTAGYTPVPQQQQMQQAGYRPSTSDIAKQRAAERAARRNDTPKAETSRPADPPQASQQPTMMGGTSPQTEATKAINALEQQWRDAFGERSAIFKKAPELLLQGDTAAAVRMYKDLTDKITNSFNVKTAGMPGRVIVDADGNVKNPEASFASFMHGKPEEPGLEASSEAVSVIPDIKADTGYMKGQILSYYDFDGKPLQPLIDGERATTTDVKNILSKLTAYDQGNKVFIHPADWAKVRHAVYEQRFNELSGKYTGGQKFDVTPGSGAAGKDGHGPTELDDFSEAAIITGRVVPDSSRATSERSVTDIVTEARMPDAKMTESELYSIRQSHLAASDPKAGRQLSDRNKNFGNDLLAIANEKASAAEVKAALDEVATLRASPEYKSLLANSTNKDKTLSPQKSMLAMQKGEVINDASWNDLNAYLKAKGVDSTPVAGKPGEKLMEQLGNSGKFLGMVATFPVSIPTKLGSLLDAPIWRKFGSSENPLLTGASRRPGTIFGAVAGIVLSATAIDKFHEGLTAPQELGTWGTRYFNIVDLPGDGGLPAGTPHVTEQVYWNSQNEPGYFNKEVFKITRIPLDADSQKNIEDQTAIFKVADSLTNPALRSGQKGQIVEGLIYELQRRARIGTDKLESAETINQGLRKATAISLAQAMEDDPEVAKRLFEKQLGIKLSDGQKLDLPSAVSALGQAESQSSNTVQYNAVRLHLARLAKMNDEAVATATPQTIGAAIEANRDAATVYDEVDTNVVVPGATTSNAPTETTVETNTPSYKSRGQFLSYVRENPILFDDIDTKLIPSIGKAWDQAVGSNKQMDANDAPNFNAALQQNAKGLSDYQRNQLVDASLPSPS